MVDPRPEVGGPRPSSQESKGARSMSSLDLTEAQIAVHWKEEEYIQPPASFAAQANLKDPNVARRFSLENFPQCFDEYAELLPWYKKWDQTLDSSNPPFWKWF